MYRIPVSSISSDDTRIAGFWHAADGQGSIDMTGSTLAEACADLLAQCTDDEQRARILAGTIEVV